MKFKSKTFGETPEIHFPRGKFDMSRTRQGSYDWGLLYPVACEEVIPGDKWDLGVACAAQLMPTISPIKHEINIRYHAYFVPYSILPGIVSGEDLTNYNADYPYENQMWTKYITGGFEGEDEQTLTYTTPNENDMLPGSLWDHLNLPMGIPEADWPANRAWPAPFTAYQIIANEYYRDETLQDAVRADSWQNTFLRHANWPKDYFTAAQLWQQRGISPAIPVEGTAQALFDEIVAGTIQNDSRIHANVGADSAILMESEIGEAAPIWNGTITASGDTASYVSGTVNIPPENLDSNTVELTGLGIAIDQLRLAIATQRFLERNMRGGVRYTEFLQQHFKVGPTDDRLSRPEYIGGYRQQITTQEVIQVSQTTTGSDPSNQGTRRGIGSAHGAGNLGEYHVKEFGIIMVIMSIVPKAMYTQGLARQWRPYRNRYDFPFPEFANLSEQAILTQEVYASDETTNNTIWGYQGRFDEYRQRTNEAVALMRTTTDGLGSWNLARQFDAAPGLTGDFLQIEIDVLKERTLAIPSEPGFVVTTGILAYADRPLPEVATPGLLDHV